MKLILLIVKWYLIHVYLQEWYLVFMLILATKEKTLLVFLHVLTEPDMCLWKSRGGGNLPLTSRCHLGSRLQIQARTSVVQECCHLMQECSSWRTYWGVPLTWSEQLQGLCPRMENEFIWWELQREKLQNMISDPQKAQGSEQKATKNSIKFLPKYYIHECNCIACHRPQQLCTKFILFVVYYKEYTRLQLGYTHIIQYTGVHRTATKLYTH